MKTFMFLLISLTVSFFIHKPANAQPPNFLWIVQAGGTGSDVGKDITIDVYGNCIVTGGFKGIASFGDTTLWASTNSSDMYVVKYSGCGDCLWACRAGGSYYVTGNDIVTDRFGNIFVIGSFEVAVSFDDTTLFGAGAVDVFIAKYDSGGHFLWVRQVSGINFVQGWGIGTERQGNIIITGDFEGTVNFGDTTLTSMTTLGIFIAKYHCNGNLLWARQAGGNNCSARSGVTDKWGNNIITGFFEDTVFFGDTTLNSLGRSRDIFIAKYDANGDFLWARQEGGPDEEWGRGIETDNFGNTVVTGNFESTASFGDTTLTSAGGNDIFLVKYDDSGNFLWARQAGGWGTDMGLGVTADNFGNSILTGRFQGPAHFGNTMLNGFSSGWDDIFLAKYDEQGQFLWALEAGGPYNDVGRGIGIDTKRNIILTGEFENTASFGDTSLTSFGNWDIFIAKIAPDPLNLENLNSQITSEYRLAQNYPNPFNPSTTIEFDLPKTSEVTLKIFNILGEEVAVLVSDRLSTGSHSYDWDASNLASGVYLYRLQADDYIEIRKMILMR